MVPMTAAHAASGMDYVLGGPAADQVRGTPNAEIVGGRGGDDDIFPGRGADIVRGGPGNDTIVVRNDGSVDRIHCGSGFDTVAYASFVVDQRDIIDANCEGVIA